MPQLPEHVRGHGGGDVGQNLHRARLDALPRARVHVFAAVRAVGRLLHLLLGGVLDGALETLVVHHLQWS